MAEMILMQVVNDQITFKKYWNKLKDKCFFFPLCSGILESKYINHFSGKLGVIGLSPIEEARNYVRDAASRGVPMAQHRRHNQLYFHVNVCIAH